MTTSEKTARRKIRLRGPAADLGNVSKASNVFGCSRRKVHKTRCKLRAASAAELIDCLPGPRRPHPSRVPETVKAPIHCHSRYA